MTPRVRAVTAILFLDAVSVCPPIHAQPGLVGASSGGTGAVSPAVVATWSFSHGSSGLPEFDLLVLWRGTPEWFMNPQGELTGSGSM